MHVRAATHEDVAALLPMVRAICALHEQADPVRFAALGDVEQRYARWLPARASDPRSVLLVAERQDASLAGFVVGTVEPEVPIFRVREFGWIHDLWVEPADRRAGVGAALANAAVRAFAAMGVPQVRLETGAFNDAARAMFARCGFRPSAVEMLRSLTPADRA
jgi:ribosomal protein S18 acetylase RimI-like enzyme